MCKAIEDMRIESWEEGKKEGIEEGIKKGEKLGIKKGEQIGITKGEKNGIKKEKKQTVLRMLQLGKFALEDVSAISGLPLEEVKKLQTNQSL